jgi:hypothetical protein
MLLQLGLVHLEHRQANRPVIAYTLHCMSPGASKWFSRTLDENHLHMQTGAADNQHLLYDGNSSVREVLSIVVDDDCFQAAFSLTPST